MIIKLPKKDDPFKNDIEKIAEDLKSCDVQDIDQQAQREILEKIKKNLPQFENEIKELIDSIKSDILNCNVQQILEYFCAKYVFYSPDSIEEDIDDIDTERNFKLDYLHSLITAIGEKNDIDCCEEILERIDENLEKIKIQSSIYLMFTSDYHGVPNQIKFLQTIHNMIVRGDSYSTHKIQTCREMFSKYDEVLKKEYNLTANELIDELINISECPINNIKIKKTYFDEMRVAHEIFVEKMEKKETDEEKFEFTKIYKSSNTVKEINNKFKKIQDDTGSSFGDSVFKINKTSLPEDILDSLSIKIGNNEIFKKGRIEYFPTNDTSIYDKPLILIDKEYFCFNPFLIYYYMHTILENLILNIIPPKKHQKNYYKKKGEYLEDISLELFEKILPKCEVYKNLKYGKDDEVDGIVIYDNHIFIVEAKSNKFTLGARKGNVDKIKRNTKDIIEKAYQQAIRAKKYILSNEKIDFRNKNNKLALTIDKNEINGIYLINTTLEPLNHITTNLTALKEFGFIQDDEWIWSVYLNDLRIIAEILDSPSEFLVYIERRIKFNDYPSIRMAEEIDIFGYFLSEGLYFDDIYFPENGFMLNIDSSFSKNIDSYYHWKEGNLIEEQEKPTFFQDCKDNIKFLVKEIEKTDKENLSILTKCLLSLDCYTQILIKEQIELILKSKRTDFHTFIDEANIGVVFITNKVYKYDKMHQQCKLYAYERKINNWFVIVIGENSTDFKKFHYDNKSDKLIEKNLKELKQYRLQQTINIQKKIGRNETCPCGSGKKYKKCCLYKS